VRQLQSASQARPAKIPMARTTRILDFS